MSERKQFWNYCKKAEQTKVTFSKSIKSPGNTHFASFMAAEEILNRAKPSTNGDFLKESFTKVAEDLFLDFTINKQEIIQKIKDMPPLAKAVKDRAFKMSINITTQQIEDINAAQAYSISTKNMALHILEDALSLERKTTMVFVSCKG